MSKIQRIIRNLFLWLFFLVPIILWPFTSELFEFNKIITVYIFTVLISAFWIIRMILERKIIFRRTILDIPLLAFLGSQVISTIISIDPQTSIFGYYSRFNGGLLSTICYLLLYWAFVSNIYKEDLPKLIKSTLISGTIVSIYGVLERLGIDKNIWQQDVQSRVFSTLGQPNWLAAWIVALIPITWVRAIQNSKIKASFRKFIPYILSSLFFIVLLFTGSRSGLLGLAVAEIVFWIYIFVKSKLEYKKIFLGFNGIMLLFVLIFGTQVTPSIFKIIKSGINTPVQTSENTGGTVLESGGTESGTIRKIVWQGAIDIWKHYPIFGTGVETFAYSYYLYRPAAHNLTSESDFIYNKAHNEYLNFMANTGTVGIVTYFILIIFSVLLIINPKIDLKHIFKSTKIERWELSAGFIAGYFSILVTNFFGFSVVVIQLLFFLFPAFAVALSKEEKSENQKPTPLSLISPDRKVALFFVSVLALATIIVIIRYWYADTLFAKGTNLNRNGNYSSAFTYLSEAVKIEPNQPVFYGDPKGLAFSLTALAISYNENKNATVASQLSEAAIDSIVKAVNLSPANVNLKRMEFAIFVMLSSIDQNYLVDARDILLAAISQAPTDAKLRYNLGLIYSRIGQTDLAIQELKEAVELKSDYKDARLAYGILLKNAKKNDLANQQFEYILKYLDPTDAISKQYLDGEK